MDDDERRRRLVEAGHPAVAGRPRLHRLYGNTVHPGAMSASSEQHADATWPHPSSAAARDGDQWRPGAPYPDPTVPDGSTNWGAPVGDYAVAPDGAGGWGVPDEPAAVPPPIPGVDGPQAQPGWLMAGRRADAGPV